MNYFVLKTTATETGKFIWIFHVILNNFPHAYHTTGTEYNLFSCLYGPLGEQANS
jgi:hypothetical protein